MPTSQDIYNELQGLQGQMQGLQGQVAQYTPVQAQDVYNELLSRVDNFKPLYQGLRNAETQAYAEPTRAMSEYYNQFQGDPSKGPSALTRLDAILNNIGRLRGTASTMQDVINQQGGRLQDMANTALGQYNSARQNLQDQIGITQGLYNNKLGLYQTALQREAEERARQEAERARQEQLRMQREVMARQQKEYEDARAAEAERIRKEEERQKVFSASAAHGTTREYNGETKVYDKPSDSWMSKEAWISKNTPNQNWWDPAVKPIVKDFNKVFENTSILGNPALTWTNGGSPIQVNGKDVRVNDLTGLITNPWGVVSRFF